MFDIQDAGDGSLQPGFEPGALDPELRELGRGHLFGLVDLGQFALEPLELVTDHHAFELQLTRIHGERFEPLGYLGLLPLEPLLFLLVALQLVAQDPQPGLQVPLFALEREESGHGLALADSRQRSPRRIGFARDREIACAGVRFGDAERGVQIGDHHRGGVLGQGALEGLPDLVAHPEQIVQISVRHPRPGPRSAPAPARARDRCAAS